jgi:uncharacterized protein YhaN
VEKLGTEGTSPVFRRVEIGEHRLYPHVPAPHSVNPFIYARMGPIRGLVLMSRSTLNSKFFPFLLALVGVITATALYLTTSVQELIKNRDAREAAMEQLRHAQQEQKQIDDNQVQLDKLTQDLKRIDKSLEQFASQHGKPPDNSESIRQIALLRQDLGALKYEISTIHTSVDRLNDALMTTPDKALMAPLLKKDVDDLKISSQRELDSVRGEMARAYDLNKWLIGLILAAVLGLLANAMIQSKSRATTQRHSFE